MTVSLYVIFHLNIAFSAIDDVERPTVIDQCYWPLLRLARDGIPIALEATGYTLETINKIDPEWIVEFKQLLANKKCELLASGDSQIIGPLVPALVNEKNLSLGQKTYKSLLNFSPNIAYINEQAFSAGLLDIYINAGYETVVVEYDNIFSNVHTWDEKILGRPTYLRSLMGRRVRAIWNHTVSFQKFQRYAHGEISLAKYNEYLNSSIQNTTISFPLYGSDAEVFNFRPNRYKTEFKKKFCEWNRIKIVLIELMKNKNFTICLPSKLSTCHSSPETINATSAEHPILVKKQPKYNISRWALSGRNDLLFNSLCHKRFKKISNNTNATDEQWRDICRLWTSDLRTHLTQERYVSLSSIMRVSPPSIAINPKKNSDKEVNLIYEENLLKIHKKNIRIALNLYRGLSIEYLAFAAHDFVPILGRISHGHFNNVNFCADFYSNHLIAQIFDECKKVTDLNPISVSYYKENGNEVIYCKQQIELGTIVKWYKIKESTIDTGIHFDNKTRPYGSLRLGFVTLMNCSSRAWFETKLGGHQNEYFQVSKDVDYGASVSPTVSSTTALGATDGTISFGAGRNGIHLSWDPAKCASLPMISSLQAAPKQYLNRLFFSLAEADETLRKDGQLLDFSFSMEPIKLENS